MWAGGVVTVGAMAALAVYFAVVGLERAEKIATVLALFIALAGLALAVPGLLEMRRDSAPPGELDPPPPAGKTKERSSPGNRTVNLNGPNNIYNEAPSRIHIENYKK